MSCDNQTVSGQVYVESLSNLSTSTQAEKIADSFAKVSNEYLPLKSEDIDLNQAANVKPFPWITPSKIHQKIHKMKSKTATVIGDIPWKVIKEFSPFLSYPLEDIYNRSVIHGEYANIWKIEIVTPVPKVFPPSTEEELRKISCTKNFSKVFESILSEFLIEDMKPTSDPSQFGNEKGVSSITS